MASVTFEHVYKKFGDVIAVNDLNIEIEDKEFLVLVGPSAAARPPPCAAWPGLEEISDGRILIGDQVVNDVAPKDRDIAMVFQSYALYPHMTRLRQHGLRPQAAQDPQGRDQAPCRRSRQDPGHRRPAGPQTPPALRRSAPACGSRARHRARAEGFPLRRTALQPGCQAARRNPRQDQQAAPAAADHLHLRDPRPGGSHDHGHPHRGDQQGPPAADRHPADRCTIAPTTCSWLASSAPRR